MDEAIRAVKAKYEAANLTWKQSKVEEEAKILFDAVNERGRLGGMSVLSPEGQRSSRRKARRSVPRAEQGPDRLQRCVDAGHVDRQAHAQGDRGRVV